MKTIKILRFSVVLFFAFALSGCVKERFDAYIADSEVTVVIKVPGPSRGNTRAIVQNSADDYAVTRVDILMFDATTKVYAGRIFSNVITGAGNTKTFTAKMPVGDFDLMVLANAKDIIDNDPPTVGSTTKTQAYGMFMQSLPPSGGWNALPGSSGYINFPMWGEVDNFNAGVTTTISNVDLVRMLAKVNLSFASQAAADKLFIEEIRLCNFNKFGYLTSRGWNWNGTVVSDFAPDAISSTNVGGFSSGIVYANSVANPNVINHANYAQLCKDEIFLFEVAKPVNPAAATSSVCLIIKGRFDGSSTSTYYRIDMVNSSGAYFDIIRNHYYDIKIIDINGPGHLTGESAFDSKPVNITTQINAWNEAGMNDITYNGQYQLVVNRSEFDGFDQHGSTPQALRVYTDFPSGWTIEIDPINDFWIRVNPTSYDNSAIPFESVEVEITCEFNDWNEIRTGSFWIVAGPLRKQIFVTQDDGSIIFDGGSTDLLYIMEDGTLGVGKWSPFGPVTQENVLYFKFGGVVGFTMPHVLPGGFIDWSDLYPTFGIGAFNDIVVFNPTGVTIDDFPSRGYAGSFDSGDNDLPNLPGYDPDDFNSYNIYNTSSRLYHTGYNVRINGKGDPCKLVGMRAADIISASSDAEITNYFSGWRLPGVNDNIDFMGAPTSWYAFPPVPNEENRVIYDGDYWGPNAPGYTGPSDMDWDGGWFPLGTQPGEGLFLPALGYAIPTGLGGQGLFSAYWTSTPRGAPGNASDSNNAYGLYIGESMLQVIDYFYNAASPIRCIRDAPTPPLSVGGIDLLYFDEHDVLRIGEWGNEVGVENVAYFKPGSVVGFVMPDLDTVQIYGQAPWDVSLIRLNPTGQVIERYATDEDSYGRYGDISNTLPNVPGLWYTDWRGTATPLLSDPAYHSYNNVINRGKGDPCQLVGLTSASFSGMNSSQFNTMTASSQWRLPTAEENVVLMGIDNVQLDGRAYFFYQWFYGADTEHESYYNFWDDGTSPDGDNRPVPWSGPTLNGGWLPVVPWDAPLNISDGTFFPVTGYFEAEGYMGDSEYVDGVYREMGYTGVIHSSTMQVSRNNHSIGNPTNIIVVLFGGGSYQNVATGVTDVNTFAFPVRCVPKDPESYSGSIGRSAAAMTRAGANVQPSRSSVQQPSQQRRPQTEHPFFGRRTMR
ncbi:MAG: DUF4906 domain-containing protein [Rikenellaceae bacterium]|nr:DUF4906 domain-containing protein [Rikenellaceae bacterium]MCL2693041.1 DUF4906 domain-containing protein [Rikenellaceae bacterium]